MAGTETNNLQVPQSVTVGAALDVRRFQRKSVHYALSGGSATVTIQISNDPSGTVWTNHTIGIATDTYVDIPEYCLLMRIDVTVYGSGQPVALFAGFDPV